MIKSYPNLTKAISVFVLLFSISMLQAQTVDIKVNKKDVNDNTPNVGQSITYTMEIQNDGPDDATGVEMLDLLPAGLTFVSATPDQGTYTSGTGIWDVGNVDAGSKAELVIVATVAAGYGGDTITNTISLNDVDQTDDDGANDSFSRDVFVNSPDLQMTKTVSDATPNIGQSIVYTIEVKNNGNGPATGIYVYDLLSTDLNYISHTTTSGSYNTVTGLWDVNSTLAKDGKETMTITVSPKTGTTGFTILNIARVDSLDEADLDLTDNQDTISVLVNGPEMLMTKTVNNIAPDELESYVYTVKIDNDGTGPATGVYVYDLIPATLNYISHTTTQGTYNQVTGLWNVGSITNGANETMTITVSPKAGTAGTTILNIARVDSLNENDPNLANNQDTVSVAVNTAELGITKTVNNIAPDELESFAYTVRVQNFGEAPGTGIYVYDLLPATLNYISHTTTQGTYDQTTGLWNVGTLAKDASRILTITVSPKAGTAGTTILNIARVDSVDQPDLIPANDQDTVSVLVNTAELAITKTVSEDQPDELESITYTIEVQNNGDAGATGVVVYDLIPTTLNYISHTTTLGTYNQVTGLWTVGPLAKDADEFLTITVSPKAGTSASTILNIAKVDTVDQPDLVSTNDQDTASITVNAPDIQIIKTVTAAPHNELTDLTYTLTVKNVGLAPATGVDISDLLPGAVTFVSSTASQGSYDDATGIWTLGSLTVGQEVSLDIVVQPIIGSSGTDITNTAVLLDIDQNDSNASNNTSSVAIFVAVSDLELTKSVSDATPDTSQTIEYSLSVDNNGDGDATNIVVEDILPAGLIFSSFTTTPVGTTADTSAGVITWNISDLDDGQNVTLDFEVKVDNSYGARTITNIARIADFDQVDTIRGNNQDTIDIVVNGADVSITKSVDIIAPNPGDTVTYTIVVTNNGPLASNDVKIYDALPSGVTYLSSTADESSYVPGTNLWGGTGNLDLSNLEERTLTIKATVDGGTVGTSITNTAYIQSASQPDSYNDNDTASAIIAIGEADLGITKTVDQTVVEEGDTLTYTIIVENDGPDNAPLVEVLDLLPSNMTYVSHSGGTYSSTTGIWSVGTLNDGVLDTLTLLASVNTGTAGREIYNTATASSAMNEPLAATLPNIDSVSFQVKGADIEIIKTVSASPPIAEDDTITYTILAINNGPDSATGVKISDFLPTNLTFMSSTTTQGTYYPISGLWDTLALGVGDTATLTITTQITKGGGFNNTAKVLSSDQDDSYTENNSSTVFISALKNFDEGACIINMGQSPQTYDNTLKAYGLLWKLVKEELVPVDWAIRPDKSFVDSLVKVDQIDFSVDGVDYYSGAFIIDELFVADAQFLIDSFTTYYPTMEINCDLPAFQAPIHKTLTSFPKAVLDQQNGGLIESAFYDNIGIENELLGYYDAPINEDPKYSLYRPDGLPSNLNNCDDIYAMPHADPHTWDSVDIVTFDAFIKNGGWLWAACHAPSSLETLVDIPGDAIGAPQMNYLSDTGLVLWGDHGNGTLPYYSALDEDIGQYNSTAASDPFMQFMGEVDNALQSGSEQIYIPFAEGWRPSTTIAVYDKDHPELTGDGEYPLNAAALVAYGKAYGNPDYGTLVYQASHTVASGSEAENVASARIYGNFWVQAGVDFRPDIVPTAIPDEIFSGIESVFSVEYNPALTYTWLAECGGTFSNPDSSWTTFTPPLDVDTPVRCIMRLIVEDECGRTNFLAEPYIVYPYADIWLDKTATDTVVAGDTITYNITVSNLGPSPSVELVIRDVLPTGTTVVDDTASVGTWSTPDWTIGGIDPGDTVTLTLFVATDAGLSSDSITNLAYVKSLSVDTINNNDTSTAVTFVISPCDAELSGNPDSDGDGISDVCDLDNDNDGIPDAVEVCGNDTSFVCANNPGGSSPTLDDDKDGTPNYQDSDYCTLNAASVCDNLDTDGDGIIDIFDLDADNDGIPDVVEAGGVDVNGDGIADGFVDTDEDGLNDVYDSDNGGNLIPTPDTDGDGLSDFQDLDADNDGIPDVVEAGGTDVNGDGRADDYVDADGDGFNDVVDGDPTNALTLGTDTDGANTSNVLVVTGTDTDGDGEPNSFPGNDTDGDGVLDFLDLDADNDGIPDVVEAGGTDENGDGRADDYVDADNDGFNDVVDGDPTNALAVGTDTPGANTADALQLTGADTDNDGAPNSIVDGDSDGDGILDQLDLDADNDGIPDVVEAGGTDVNGDGRADGYVDADNDGFNDVVDGDPTNVLAVGSDAAGANTADALTLTGADANLDGIPDSYPNDDADGDGLRDQIDLDADNDGIPDVVEAGGTDVNGDGRADAYADADNDGFNDVVDGDPTNALAVGTDTNGANTSNATTLTGADADGDGEPDSYPNDDLDGDGILNALDLDADGDGILDIEEVGGTDANRDGIEDAYVDADNDGFNDNVDGDPTNALAVGTDTPGANTANATTLTGADTDADGVPNSYPNDNEDGDNNYNFLDIDADNDGIVDNTEAQATASYIAPAGTDADGDGIDDAYDNNDALFGGAGSGIVPNNNDGADNPDYLDLDTDNDGESDLIEGHDTNGDGVVDGSDSPNANTGLAGGTTDADGDGLLDGFDNNVASTDATNSSLNPNSHPDADGQGTERDWREVGVNIDQDNDGIPDIVENYGGDHDNDGTPDYEDSDFCDDNFDGVNGWDCSTDGLPDPDGDLDGDGTPNFQDTDFPTCGGLVNGVCTNFDADGDGIANHKDLDADNDGIPDLVEAGGTDTNGDGILDDLTDTDKDGLADAVDNDDTDGPDGTSPCSPQAACLADNSTSILLDTNGNGTTDESRDSDGDGLPDFQDLDADNDGIPDVVEAGGTDENGDGRADDYVDTDGDGFNDVVDGDVGNDGTAENSADALVLTGTDTDNDGIPNSYANGDTDGDGVLDFLDLDADNDGIPDVVEAGGTDENGDGRADDYVDADGDGFNDVVDGDPTNALAVGSDAAGANTADALQLTGADTDGDGEPDSYPDGDTDGDGILDQLDLDADNDGIPDVVEAGGTDENGDGRADDYVDADGDGFNDVVDGDPTNALAVGTDTNGANTADALQLTGADTDGDGEPDSYPDGDTDGDGILDQLDLDADNDGIPDVVEAGGTDANGDGRADDYVDADGDGFNDVVDGDPTNALAVGSDAAGANTADALVLTGADTDGDGEPDSYPEGDTDGDGILDQLDLDADNDGIPDVVEAGGTDVNGDGRADDYVDADGDGFNDVVDGDPTNALAVGSDAAGANTADALQLTGADTDGDGEPDSYPEGDTDGDGILDQLDLDADNDGIPDVVEAGGTDENGDGRADDYVDADGDGFNDVVDGDPTNALAVGTDTPGANTADALQLTGADTDNDGAPNSIVDGDSDGDGILDQLDLDADNDGIPDVVEAGGTDVNGDGRADGYVDADNDGFNDVVDGDPTNVLAVGSDAAGANTADALTLTGADANLDGIPDSYPNDDADGDGLRDQIDLDADNDGIPDVVEAGGTDVNGDGRADAYADADNDGFNDVVDGDPTNALAVGTDTNGANTSNATTLTGADADGDGEPDSYPNDDLDGDGILNALDLDADGDGILDIEEVGGTDANRDGIEDAYVDADNDGFNDNVDGDPTNALAVGTDTPGANTANATTLTGADTDNDGVPDSYPNDNLDGDNNYNFLDIDADNDGIVDNTEGQATASYIAPAGTDADGDGIDDAYDNNDALFGGAGSGIVPNNNDFTDNPDYLDLDSDNDGESDLIEGHDTNGDGVVDGSDSPNANTGLAGGTTDADGDGLLDGFDNNVASTDATNSSLNPNSHPDADGQTSERDWREVPINIDQDNDGIPDIVESYGGDHDNDGTPDYEDSDFCDDNFDGVNGWNCATDGLPDPDGDFDSDGIPNYQDADFPTCGGLVNGVCTNFDADGDGIPNHLDLDSDNDGIPDLVEIGGTDTNGDGIVDDLTDTDADGLADAVDNDDTDGPKGTSNCSPLPACLISTSTSILLDTNGNGTTDNNVDNDGDGLPNYIDLDADNDGIPDVVEAGGTDENGDGRADDYVDADGDGFNDVVDGDVGNDGTAENSANALVLTGADTDNDGMPNSYANGDIDGDGVLDFLDLDADNDGIPDVVEAGGTDENGDGRADDYVDADGDGFNDVVDGDPTNALAVGSDAAGANTADALQLTGADTDGDGEPDSYPEGDTDGDGILDQLDLDADNDGIPDVVEAGGTDENGDGRADDYVDADGDGFNDVVDGDPTNALAVGSDAAGANTADALQLTGADTDGDGEPDSYPDGDTDGDGILDQLDLDADNDGIPDVVEAGGTDANGDGRADDYVDADNDGFNDVVDGDPTNVLVVGSDAAGANTADALVLTGADTDGDGIPNSYVDGDTDGDGLMDQIDLDADNDGIPDVVEAGGTDVNGDGRADDYVDADGDGFNDVVDGDPTNALAVGSDAAGANTSDALTLTGADANGDGAPDSYPNDDTDGDGILDQLDLDADNDGIPDVVEAGGTDANGDGRADDYVDADNDGFNDVVDGDPTNVLALGSDIAGANTSDALIKTGADANGDGEPDSYPEGDFDGDGVLDQLDLDADNDGIPDVVEAGGTDVNGDGRADDYVDADNDGFNDVVDGDPTNVLAVGSDAAGANTSDALVLTGADADGNGAPDTYPANDMDGDGNLDHLDLDADNDGIPDVVEAGGTDENGDGRADDYVDADRDGFNDVVDGDPTNVLALGSDAAGANTTNALTLTGADANGDGIPDSYPNDDADGDGLRDQIDLDADNDGIPDVVEAGGTDEDGDGFADNYVDLDKDGFNDVVDGDPTNALALGSDVAGANTANAQTLTGADANLDGIPDSYPNDDTDGDGILDFLDLDADNDGIPDVVEAGGTDANGDGRADGYRDIDNDGYNDVVDGDVGNDGSAENKANAQQVTGLDTDGDGVPNSYPEDDTDGDGIRDQLDLDADNDGIPDVTEAGGVDTDGDGIADNYLDVDNDGFNDIVDGDPTNALAAGIDIAAANTANAQILTGLDTDGDGRPNSIVDGDLDGDGIYNHLDLDADGDGITDIIEVGGTDADGDGQVDVTTDIDNDGFRDSVDGDVGNDGIAENIANTQILTGVDDNLDGTPDNYPNENTDTKGFPDFLDIDADDDGIVDNVEAQSTAGYLLPGIDSDGDGIADAYEVPGTIGTFGGVGIDVNGGTAGADLNDVDNDGTPDYKDLDTDGDNIPDDQEAWDSMFDGDSEPDNGPCPDVDIDEDGLLDCYDSNTSSTSVTSYITPINDNGFNGGSTTASAPTSGDTPDDIFPDNSGVDGQADWRDLVDICVDNKVFYAIIESDTGVITNYEFVDTSNQHVDSSFTSVIRATTYCEPDADGWYYYYNPLEPEHHLFAIRDAAGSPNTVPMYQLVNYVEIRVDQTPGNRFKYDGYDATYVMERDWNMIFKDDAEPDAGSTFDVKFYFPPEELMRLDSAMDYLVAQKPELTREPLEWFKANQGSGISFNYGDILFTGIDSSELITANATQVFDENTGVAVGGAQLSTDGADTTTGNGRNYIQFNGLTSFSGGTGMIQAFGGSGSTLPVELVNLEAKAVDNERIDVLWTTATEINNEGFEVLRSVDGIDFEFIGWVDGNGNSTDLINYSYSDYEVERGIVYYYRLKQIDYNGQFVFTDIVYAKLNGEGNTAEATAVLIPNPTRGEGVIEIQTKVGENIQVSVIDMYGEKLDYRQFTSATSMSTVEMDLTEYSQGVYNVIIKVGDEVTINRKWVKL